MSTDAGESFSATSTASHSVESRTDRRARLEWRLQRIYGVIASLLLINFVQLHVRLATIQYGNLKITAHMPPQLASLVAVTPVLIVLYTASSAFALMGAVILLWQPHSGRFARIYLGMLLGIVCCVVVHVLVTRGPGPTRYLAPNLITNGIYGLFVLVFSIPAIKLAILGQRRDPSPAEQE